MKLPVSMLSTIGYGALAGAVIEPVGKGNHLSPADYGMMFLAAVLLGLALQLAPEGDFDDGV